MQNNIAKDKNDLKSRVYTYSLEIIKFIDGLEKSISAQIIGKQLLRSGTSIGANIIEAQSGSSRKDFTNFYTYALKSANETKFWLGLLRDSNKSGGGAVNKLFQETNELSNILASSILTLKGKRRF